MKIIALFALLVLASHAFNLTEYHFGVDSELNFTTAQVQEGITCLNALSNDVQQVVQLLESEDVDTIALNLGELVIQIQTDLKTTCSPYFNAWITYLMENTDITNLNEIMIQNIQQNYPTLISYIGSWIQNLQNGQDFEAGVDQASFLNVLYGIEQIISDPPQVNVSEIVPFNRTAFFTEYNAGLFEVLGINPQINVSALVQCSYYAQNVTATFLYMKQNFLSYDFQQRLDSIQYLIGLTFEAINNCECASAVAGPIFSPIAAAFEEDPVGFTVEVAERILTDFVDLQSSLQTEVVDIQEGDYLDAGKDKAGRIVDLFGGLVNF